MGLARQTDATRPNSFLKCFRSDSATPNSIGSYWAGGPNAIGLGLAAIANSVEQLLAEKETPQRNS